MALMAKSESIWFRLRGPLAASVLVPVGLLVLLSRPALAPGSWPDLILGSLGWLAFFAGVGMRFWATLYIGGRKGHEVVSDGPYSLCRNPLYVGSLLLAVSVALLFRSLTLSACVVLASLSYSLGAVPAEERFLQKTHGEAFDRYCEKVPRFLPRFSGYTSPEMIEVRVKGLRTEFRRSFIWLWIPFAAEIVGRLRAEPWWPALVRQLP